MVLIEEPRENLEGENTKGFIPEDGSDYAGRFGSNGRNGRVGYTPPLKINGELEN
jgi:hypothetical protein